MHTTVPLTLSLLSLTSALPSNQKRGATDTFGDWTGSTSSFPDNSGTYVRSADDHHYASGVHCWTDLFYDHSVYVANDWQHSQYSIDCATTSNCNSATAKGNQRCTSWTLTEQVGVDLGIVKDVLNVAFSETFSYTDQQCIQTTLTETCTWDDMGCHALWTSDVDLVNVGYVRRRCDDGGDHTVWSKDMNITVPNQETRVGCGASCDATSYPGAVPLPPSLPSK